MRICSVLFLALLATSTLHCQTLDKFYIGAFWVGGNATDTVRQPNPGSVATYNEATNLPSDLPQGRFDELQDLGLNLAGIELHYNSIVRSDENGQRNVLRDITDDLVANYSTAFETDIDVCIFDWGIHTASELNRVILNPESTWDFEHRTFDSTSLAALTAFRSFPFNNLRTDRSILEQTQTINCVRFTQPGDTVRGLRFERKRELTARKNYWGDNESHHSQPKNLIAGLYHLSVVLADDEDEFTNPPNSSATVLTIRIFSTHPDSITKRVSRDFVVPGSAFYDGPTLRAAPFEYHLAQIEMRIDSFDVRTPGTSEDAWMHSALTVNDPDSTTNWERTDVLVADRLKHWKDLIDKDLMGPLEIEVFANSNAHFLVDAVCLSSPAAYGLFASGDSHAGVHSGMHTDFMTRLSAIASDRNGVGSFTTSRIPLMTVQEQRPSIGSWPSARVVGAALADSLPHCLPYSAHGAEVSTEDMGPLLEFHRNMVSGFYTYSVDYAYPRMCEDPDPSAYYDSLYQHYSFAKAGRMRDNVTRYRSYTVSRALRGIHAPWIPFVQNHSNMFVRDADSLGVAWDKDPLREPNAAELRLMCNIALAHGADGIMFYQYNTHGARIIDAANACWPRLRRDWVLDSTRQIHTNSGSMGFLGANNLPRVCDTNGENKWDSTKTYIAGFLRPVGELLREMTWERSKSWYCGEGEAQLVSKVISQRQDALDPIDGSSETFVETAEFSDAGTKHLLVINGRAHREGQRHITVKLARHEVTYDEWKVTNVQTGDIWIVRPNDAPDSTSTANGFTEFFAPGSAALYRLEPFADETLDFDGECLSGSIFIEPAAMLYIKPSDNLRFRSGRGLYCDGQLFGQGASFDACDTEITWEGIVARNNGEVNLVDALISRGGVVAGSGGTVGVNNIQVSGTSTALRNYGGVLESEGSTSTDVFHHLSVVGPGSTGTPSTWLVRDIATGNAEDSSTAVFVSFGDAAIDEIEAGNFWRSIRCLDGHLIGDVDGAEPVDGLNNRLSSVSIGLEAGWSGSIDLGEIRISPTECARNLIAIDSAMGYHAICETGSTVAARQNWWDPLDLLAVPDPIRIQGTVLYDYVRTDPLPFAPTYRESLAGGRTLEKSIASQPTPTFSDSLRAAFKRRDTLALRSCVTAFLQSPVAAVAEYTQLRRIHSILRQSGEADLVDSLLLLCLRRPDVESKLLACDIATADSLYSEAIQILNSYSFIARPSLQTRALVRKTQLYPRSGPGGYVSGLSALDSLLSLAGIDGPLLDYAGWYPRLYSGLTSVQRHAIPKLPVRSLLDRVIPSSIVMGQNYPNPFSAVTSFTFKLPDTREVKLTVHDMLGRELTVVKQGMLDRGVHSAVLHAERLSAGMYLYRLQAGSEVLQGRMVLVR